VHHVEGYRNVSFDDLTTVITVCPKHHRVLEKFTNIIRGWPPERRRLAALVLLGVLGDTRAYHVGRALLEESA